jgi:hypothetical protein
MAHWRRETRAALRAGNHVVVFATDWEQFYVYTGERDISGTGRSTRVTHRVAAATNYDWLPLDIGKVVSANGRSMNLARGAEFMGPYWRAVGADSEYRVYVENPEGTAVLTTKSGQRVVGLLARGGTAEGALLLMPPLAYDEDEFTTPDGNWTKKAVQMGKRVFAALVELAKALSAGASGTPEPPWATAQEFALAKEAVVKAALRDAEAERKALDERVATLEHDLASLGKTRALLYESGRPLEDAVMRALQALGFKADRYRDSGSEFDVVFSSEEGRFLGEVEGKDAAAA